MLAETTIDTFRPLNSYIHHVLNNSISCLEVVIGDIGVGGVLGFVQSDSCKMTLLDNEGEVQKAAGLNWGQNPNNHTTPNDAYIAIRTIHVKTHPHLFLPKQENPQHFDSRGRMRRHNDSIEIIWDDGITMEGLLEGSQPINGLTYPKQISSFPSKAQLGEYFRSRIGVPLGQPIRKHHLLRYGRTDIDVSLLGEGLYKFDFSV